MSKLYTNVPKLIAYFHYLKHQKINKKILFYFCSILLEYMRLGLKQSVYIYLDILHITKHILQ